MKSVRSRAWCAFIVACAGSVLASAAGAERDALTLRAAIDRAVQHNPDIAGFAASRELAQREAEVAALAPATSLEVELENFAGTGQLSSAQSLETTLQLSRVVELGDKAALRRGVGESDIERVEATQRSRRADVLADVARRFIHVLADQERVDVSARSIELAERARSAVEARVRAGAASQIFLSRAEISLARTRIAHEHAEHELASSRVALASVLGDSTANFSEVRGDLFAFPNIEPLDAYAQRLDANPDLLSFASDARVLDARERLAQAQRSPNITVSMGVRRIEAFDDQALVAGFSMPLGSARRARPELLALKAQREQLGFSVQSRRLELNSTLFALYQEVLHARTEAQALHDDIRPQAERLLQTSDAGFRAGRFSLIELNDAQIQLLEIEVEAIRAAAEFHTNLIEIERVTGEAVHAFATR